MSTPILMGKKFKPIDYTKFDERAKAVLGRIPGRKEKLTADELHKMGFEVAASHFRGMGRGRDGY